eukprot:14145182-Alexandrium_andersonii.AAC.1
MVGTDFAIGGKFVIVGIAPTCLDPATALHWPSIWSDGGCLQQRPLLRLGCPGFAGASCGLQGPVKVKTHSPSRPNLHYS